MRLTPETQLILLLARGRPSPDLQEQPLAPLAAPLKWDLILEQVMTQELYPLFHRNLEALGYEGRQQAVLRSALHLRSPICHMLLPDP